MQINSTELSIEWLVEKLQAVFHVHDVLLESWQILSETCGERLLSHVVAVTLQWSVESALPKSVVLKVKEKS